MPPRRRQWTRPPPPAELEPLFPAPDPVRGGDSASRTPGVRRRRALVAPVAQSSLFGADAATPGLLDLDGILLAGGRWARLGGTARLSVVVPDAWRAEALAVAYAERGVAGEEPTRPAESGLAVRTAFATGLAEHATRWLRGANEAPPVDLALSALGLRLWAIAGGATDDAGYLFPTAAPDDAVHRSAGHQLATLGVAAISLGGRGGPGWRVTSARRLRRLAELLGPAPDGAAADWPS